MILTLNFCCLHYKLEATGWLCNLIFNDSALTTTPAEKNHLQYFLFEFTVK